jgi:hypothetical protein
MRATTMVGLWMLTRGDGDWLGEKWSWLDGGRGDEPDWVGFEEDDFDDPIEALAERFVSTDLWSGTTHGQTRYRREVRRRWFGGTEHEWGQLGYDTEVCINCSVDRSIIGHVSAPFNKKCDLR